MIKYFYILAFFTAVSCGIKYKSQESQFLESSEEIYDDEDRIESSSYFPHSRPVYRAAETILTDIIHTKLEVNFDWKNARMNGIASITARPYFYSSDSLILDAKGMTINSVQMNGKPLEYIYKDDYLKIKLGKTYARNDEYTVVIDYIARPEERTTGGSAAILSDKGLYFINPNGENENKMPQIWTQGETESSSVWFPTIDAPNTKTTQEIFITVNEKYTTLSNGKLVSSKKLDNGMRVDHWKQELPHSPYLFMMGVGEFKVVKDSYTRKNGSIMEVNYYVEPEWEEFADDIFGETPEMIRFFSELTGVEYPWDKYNQIVVRDYVSGAMENTGAVIFGDFVYKNDRELLDENDQSTIAHELFHHWFGDLVTCESWSNLPLNESFANYSQYLWDEHRYGLDEADFNAEHEADGYYQTGQMQGYHDLIWFDYEDKEEMFDGHSYNKGGRILHMLRNYLGDEAFFAGIKLYLENNKFKPAEFHHLRLAFEEVCGEDLNWFFNQWFLASGHPVLNFTQEIDLAENIVRITVEQKQKLDIAPIYKLPMEMAVFDSKGKHIHRIVVDEIEQTFEFPFSNEFKGIIYDNQQMLLAKKKEINKPVEQYIYQYYNGNRYAARKTGLREGLTVQSDAGQKMVLDALSDSFREIRIMAIERAESLIAPYKGKALTIIKELAVKDSSSAVRVAAIQFLATELPELELIAIYKDRIANDKSYAVVSASLRSFGKINPDEAIKMAENMEQEKSSSMISGIAQLYATKAGTEKLEFFKKTFSGNVVQGFDRLGLMNAFTYYLSRQDAIHAAESIEIYKNIVSKGGYYEKMFLPQNINYLVDNFNAKIEQKNEELAEFEKNKDAAYADKCRKEISEIEKIKSLYVSLQKEAEDNRAH